MYQYLITKYDKGKRDINGTYQGLDNWTECSDIGRTRNGKKLRFREYQKVEARYIESVMKFFKASGLPHLRLTCATLLDWQLSRLRSHNKKIHEVSFFSVDFSEDRIVKENEIPIIIKMILRDLAWGKLEIKDKFYVHFGYDFYMYVGTTEYTANLIDQIEEDGLYVIDNCASPSNPHDIDKNIILIDRRLLGGEYVDESFKIELDSSYLEPLKSIFGYSKEHPFLGAWDIDPKLSGKLTQLLGHSFDVENYQYSIMTQGWDE